MGGCRDCMSWLAKGLERNPERYGNGTPRGCQRNSPEGIGLAGGVK